MPERLPYLHPSQRNLRTEQIGPSSHKNEYRSGVLIGDHSEAKASQNLVKAQPKLQTRTINRNSYYPITKPEPALFSRPQEYQKELLFGHSGFVESTAQRAQPLAPKTSKIDKKKEEWDGARDPDATRILAKTTTATVAYKVAEQFTDLKPSEYAVKGEFRKQMKYLNQGALRLRS